MPDELSLVTTSEPTPIMLRYSESAASSNGSYAGLASRPRIRLD
jgi:hypothetical protein